MATANLDLVINLKGADKADATLGRLSGTLGKVGGVASALGKAALFTGIGTAVAGVAGLSAAIVGGIGDAREAQLVMAQTEAVIKSTGGAAGVTAQEVADLGASLSAASGKSLFGDTQIQESTNLLLTFTNIKGAVLDAATAVSVDMAQALGGAPADAAIQLGKALNDPIAGISALSRVGVSFSEDQKAVIKSLVDTGDVAGAQQIIIAELNKEFGGSAEAAAKADGGFAMLRDRLGEAAETVGAAFLPAFGQLGALLNSPAVMGAIEGLAEALAGRVSAAITWLSTTGIPMMIGAWQSVQPALATVVGALQSVWNAAQLLITGDFTGGIFGLAEDSPIIDFLFNVRDAAINAFGLARDAVLTFVQALQGDWVNAEQIHPLHQAFGTIGTVIREQVIPAVMGVVAWFQRNWEAISQVGVAVSGAVVTFQAVSGVIGVAAAGVASLAAVLTAILSPIGLVIAAAALLGTAWVNNWGGIQEKTAAFVGWWNTSAVPVIKTGIQGLDTASAEFEASWRSDWARLQPHVQAFSSWWTGTAVPGIKTGIRGLDTASGELEASWNTDFVNLRRGTEAVQTWWSGTAVPGFTGAIDRLKNASGLFRSSWDGDMQTIRTAAGNAIDGVRTAFGNLITVVSGAAERAGAAARAIGENIITGIRAGITGGWAALVGHVTGLLGGLVGAAQRAIRGRSPSREFAEKIGEPIGLGIAMGIQWSKATIKRALLDTLDEAIRTTMPVAGQIGTGLGAALTGGMQGSAEAVCEEVAKINDCLSNGSRFGTMPVNAGISLGDALGGARPPSLPPPPGGLAGIPRISLPGGTPDTGGGRGTNRPFGIGGDVNLTIVQQPNEDARALADRILNDLDRRVRLRSLASG